MYKYNNTRSFFSLKNETFVKTVLLVQSVILSDASNETIIAYIQDTSTDIMEGVFIRLLELSSQKIGQELSCVF